MTDIPEPRQSRSSAWMRSRTESGRAAGPALKLKTRLEEMERLEEVTMQRILSERLRTEFCRESGLQNSRTEGRAERRQKVSPAPRPDMAAKPVLGGYVWAVAQWHRQECLCYRETRANSTRLRMGSMRSARTRMRSPRCQASSVSLPPRRLPRAPRCPGPPSRATIA